MEFARVDAGDATPAPKPLLGLDSAYWFKIIEAAIMCVTALLIGLFVARPLIDRMFAPNAAARRRCSSPAPLRWPARCPRPRQAGASASAARRPQLAARAAAKHRSTSAASKARCANPPSRKSAKWSNAHPEEALAIIRTWLHQPV